MAIWALVGLSILGYFVIGFVVDFCTAIVNTGDGWGSTEPEQFFRDMIKDVQRHLREHVVTFFAWLPIFFVFLYWFLKGGIKVVLAGTKRESAT